MKIHNSNIKDCFFTVNKNFTDNRGVFCEIFRTSNELFKTHQVNYSFSKKGVLRGIHKTPYAKFVTCVSGSVHDVCVDLRRGSSTFEQYFSLKLTDYNFTSLYIPPNCGHGFLALEDSIVVYCQDSEYRSELDETFCYKSYNIDWPINIDVITSEKDSSKCNE